METIIFALILIQDPAVRIPFDLPVEIFQTMQACEEERKSGEFKERFRCSPVSGRESAYTALLFSRLVNCEPEDRRCNDIKDRIESAQRKRHRPARWRWAITDCLDGDAGASRA